MRVLVTPEAASQLEARKSWWRTNRPAIAELFDREFLDAVAVIGERPALFSVTVVVDGREIRRILMEKTSCHLYYEISDLAGVVKIVSAWGAVRGMLPDL